MNLTYSSRNLEFNFIVVEHNMISTVSGSYCMSGFIRTRNDGAAGDIALATICVLMSLIISKGSAIQNADIQLSTTLAQYNLKIF